MNTKFNTNQAKQIFCTIICCLLWNPIQHEIKNYSIRCTWIRHIRWGNEKKNTKSHTKTEWKSIPLIFTTLICLFSMRFPSVHFISRGIKSKTILIALHTTLSMIHKVLCSLDEAQIEMWGLQSDVSSIGFFASSTVTGLEHVVHELSAFISRGFITSYNHETGSSCCKWKQNQSTWTDRSQAQVYKTCNYKNVAKFKMVLKWLQFHHQRSFTGKTVFFFLTVDSPIIFLFSYKSSCPMGAHSLTAYLGTPSKILGLLAGTQSATPSFRASLALAERKRILAIDKWP